MTPHHLWKLLLCGVLLFSVRVPQAAAQPDPLKGVVWEVPDEARRAAEDLRQMKRMGVEAVRTGLIEDPRLLTLADTLGLRLFQELPVERLPAAYLRDTLAFAQELLAPALQRAQRHPSARHFGLARLSDTSDPAACAYFEQLTEFARARAPEGIQFYYVTPFTEDDRCTGTVDFVLLDVLGREDPLWEWVRWQGGEEEAPRAGLGALGKWVRAGSAAGMRTAHSPEAQARYLETALSTLLADTNAVPYAVFVHRWEDVRADFPSPAYDIGDAYVRAYGLFDGAGEPRLSAEVIEGLYTGRQTTFAFPLGEEPAAGFSWAVLLGWAVLILLGVFYALSPRLRQMVPRYFKAHGFYREAVREGRDILFLPSAVLLLVLALGIGVIAEVILRTVRAEEAFLLFFRWLSEDVQEAFVSLLAQPPLLILLLGSAVALALIVWSIVLSLASRRRFMLTPGQAVMLIVWPRWTILLLMIAAMVISTLPYPWAVQAALVLAGLWAVAALYALVRTVVDYAKITRVPPYVAVVVGLANPAIVLLVFGFFAALEHRRELAFLWHLIVRA